MKYYRVLKEGANKQVLKHKRNGKIAIDRNLISKELYTPREYKKLLHNTCFTKKLESYFEVVEIPKTKTYCFFGARFESGVEV